MREGGRSFFLHILGKKTFSAFFRYILRPEIYQLKVFAKQKPKGEHFFCLLFLFIRINERQRRMIYQMEGREIALGSKLFRFYTLYIFKIVLHWTKLNYRIKAMRAHTAFFSLIYQGGAVQAPSFICKKKILLLFLHC